MRIAACDTILTDTPTRSRSFSTSPIPDQSRARDLVSTADIVVENFRPGTMEKLGLGYDTLRKVRPDLIYCSITGFGRTGGAQLPGYDLLVQAVGGLMSITGSEAGEPTKAGVALVDVLAGLHALGGILLALVHRDRTGEGQRVDTNLLSVLLSSLVNQASCYLGAGIIPAIIGNRHPSIAPYQTFPTADRHITVAVGNDKQFRLLTEAIEQPWLADDERFTSNPQRVHNRDALTKVLSQAFEARAANHWYQRLTALGVPAGPINNIAEAFAFARGLGLDTTATVAGSRTPQVVNPISMSKPRPPTGVGRLASEVVQLRSAPPRFAAGAVWASPATNTTGTPRARQSQLWPWFGASGPRDQGATLHAAGSIAHDGLHDGCPPASLRRRPLGAAMVMTVRRLAQRSDLGLTLVAGRDKDDRTIAWAHAIELPDPTPYLSGGELVMTTGMNVGTTSADQFDYLARLAAAGVAALAFDTGTTFAHVPNGIIAAGDDLARSRVPHRLSRRTQHRFRLDSAECFSRGGLDYVAFVGERQCGTP